VRANSQLSVVRAKPRLSGGKPRARCSRSKHVRSDVHDAATKRDRMAGIADSGTAHGEGTTLRCPSRFTERR
jgi:hypothetical protein